MGDQARPIEGARLLSGEAFADQERRGRPPVQEPRGERERKAHRRRPVLRLGGRDLMQAVVREPAAEGGVERAPERETPRGALARGASAGRAGFGLDLGDGAPQTRHPLRSVAQRHPVHILYVRLICSCFGPKGGGSQGRALGDFYFP